jgi:molybdopterin-binding protein
MNNISACNRIDGTIAFMKKGKATTNVRMTTAIGDVTLVVTSSSVEALHLELGDSIAALYSRSGRDADERAWARISTNNRFAGQRPDMKQGGVTVEVPVEVRAAARFVAVITRSAAEEMGLAIGDQVSPACARRSAAGQGRRRSAFAIGCRGRSPGAARNRDHRDHARYRKRRDPCAACAVDRRGDGPARR